ncbi:MAG: glycoside hydrolase family 5 protein, partial [Bradyrhizobium sp.]
MQLSRVFGRFVLISLAGLAVTLAGFAAAQANAAEQITVGNRVLLRDGKVWVPKGITVVGLLGAPASNTHKPRPAYTVAWRRWGPAEIEAALRFGADTIRLQVSQPALDKESGHSDRSYLAKVRAAVRLIRAAHMNVILSMQWEVTTGVDKQVNVPTDATVLAPVSSTVRAWRTLAPPFLSDRGVIFELFNEPCVKVYPADAWQRWQAGYQPVIDALRKMGATNVLLIDGIQCGKVLADAPRLYDPDHALAYATHPYPMPEGVRASRVDMFTARDFERNFGQFQKEGHAVIATEWNVWKSNCH